MKMHQNDIDKVINSGEAGIHNVAEFKKLKIDNLRK